MPTTATITPTLGSAPVTLQAGNYSAIDDRRAWGYLTSESVSNSDAYKVIQRAAGANMTVDVQSSNGEAVVTGDSVTAQGNYTVPRTAANVNVDIAAADATNPRNDLVVLEIKDDQHDAGGLNIARVRVITGTPNASAALTDAPGANGTPALPSSAKLLAVVRVAAGATSIATAAISDRRVVVSTGAWTSWSPSVVQVGGALTFSASEAHYMQLGKLVVANFRLVCSSTGTAGTAFTVTLPVTARSKTTPRIGTGTVYDDSTSTQYNGTYAGLTTTTAFFVGDWSGSSGGWGQTPNLALTTNDQITGFFMYEAA